MSLIKIFDVEHARRSILRRQWSGAQIYSEALLEGIRARFGEALTPDQAVQRILTEVHADGAAAVKRWTTRLDRVDLDTLKVPHEALEAAWQSLDPALARALEEAAERVRLFHHRQPWSSWSTDALGGNVGQRMTPIRRVGVYVPGGSAPLPSSLLMSVIPAQVAGVSEVVVCTPPRPALSILAAARLCGLREVVQIGGAQAIAALAFGCEGLAPVDKIVGAGNLFVTLAKQKVYGLVGIDGLAGPTETMIVADATARADWAAADLLAQAEHDMLASAILLTPEAQLARAVQAEVERQLPTLARAEIARESLASHGGIVVTHDLVQAAALADAYAPEHLCLSVADADFWSHQIHNAGGLFIGEHSCEVLGDYVAGPSHVMPTGGTARFASPLNVLDFVKITSIVALDGPTAARVSVPAEALARAEGLTGHANAAALRRGAS
ncbi:MAG: histidinol dehydrogenase [Deltaproteobacteria bacterium]|nr:histidinol dehydrogenase [Deltaproteobacteria bacterium]